MNINSCQRRSARGLDEHARVIRELQTGCDRVSVVDDEIFDTERFTEVENMLHHLREELRAP